MSNNDFNGNFHKYFYHELKGLKRSIRAIHEKLDEKYDALPCKQNEEEKNPIYQINTLKGHMKAHTLIWGLVVVLLGLILAARELNGGDNEYHKQTEKQVKEAVR